MASFRLNVETLPNANILLKLALTHTRKSARASEAASCRAGDHLPEFLDRPANLAAPRDEEGEEK